MPAHKTKLYKGIPSMLRSETPLHHTKATSGTGETAVSTGVGLIQAKEKNKNQSFSISLTVWFNN